MSAPAVLYGQGPCCGRRVVRLPSFNHFNSVQQPLYVSSPESRSNRCRVGHFFCLSLSSFFPLGRPKRVTAIHTGNGTGTGSLRGGGPAIECSWFCFALASAGVAASRAAAAAAGGWWFLPSIYATVCIIINTMSHPYERHACMHPPPLSLPIIALRTSDGRTSI